MIDFLIYFEGNQAAPTQAAPADPWGAPAAQQQKQEAPAWEAFGDSFGAAAQPAPAAPAPTPVAQADPFGAAAPAPTADIFAAAPAQPAAPAPSADPFGALGEPAAPAQPAQPQVDLFGGLADQNGNDSPIATPAAPAKKTASDFLGGAGASLVNFDNLVSRSNTAQAAGMNPFGGGGGAMKSNPFQKSGPGELTTR